MSPNSSPELQAIARSASSSLSKSSQRNKFMLGLHKAGLTWALISVFALVALLSACGNATIGVTPTTRSSTTHSSTTPAILSVKPSSLDLGKLAAGDKVPLSIVISNSGGTQLSWTADNGGTKWLKILGGAGLVNHGSVEQLNLMIDTQGLQVGDYTAALHISSNGGNQAVAIKFSVTNSLPQQARLFVSTKTLDFGHLAAGQPASIGVTVSNLGTQMLNWKINAGGAPWLSFDLSSGQLAPGALQTILVTANATGMTAGLQTATLQVSSNGGDDQVAVSLDVDDTVASPPPLLAVSPSGFNPPDDANCSYDDEQGWTCTATLSSAAGASGDLNWSAVVDDGSHISFSPSSGSLDPGESVKVAINVKNRTCPASAEFNFVGPGNTVEVPWNCEPAGLQSNKGHFDANKDCVFQLNVGWTCTLKLSEPDEGQGSERWFSFAKGIDDITFSPSSGKLSPDSSTLVTITVPVVDCPAHAKLNFQAKGDDEPITIPWRCSEPDLEVSPSVINANTQCTLTSVWTCSEFLSLASDRPGDPSVHWSASSRGISGVTFSPLSGTVSAGETVRVTITVPNVTCPAEAHFIFTGEANFRTVLWRCTPPPPPVPPALIVSPLHLSNSPRSGCAHDAASNTWSCTVTLRENPRSQSDLTWSASSTLSGVAFSPSNGSLSPGQSVQVTISGIPCTNSSFTFSGGVTPVTVSWSCTPAPPPPPPPPPVPPALIVSPLHLSNSAGCVHDATWSCTVTLTENPRSQGGLTWSASSTLSGVAFSPSNGSLSPGQSVQVTISGLLCTNGFFTFSGGVTPVTVSWSCTPPPPPPSPPPPPPTPTPAPPPPPPPPAPPALLVSPRHLTNSVLSGCVHQIASNTWSCTVTLTESASSQSGLTWSATSTLRGVAFSQQSGPLSPGQSVQVTISGLLCTNGFFTFSGGATPVTVSWVCR